MAPEVLLDGRVSKAADVYAFGITLWELFTAGQPYKGAGMMGCIMSLRVPDLHRRRGLALAAGELKMVGGQVCYEKRRGTAQAAGGTREMLLQILPQTPGSASCLVCTLMPRQFR